jgi:hypothetical protein
VIVRIDAGTSWMAQPGKFILVDGKADRVPTDDSTAIRVRAFRNPGVAGRNIDNEYWVWLEVSPEPRLRWVGFVATRVEKAVDDRGQSLTESSDSSPAVPPAAPAVMIRSKFGTAGTMYVPGSQKNVIRINKGDKPSKALKQLSGTLTIRVLTDAQPMITVEDVLKAADKTAKGAEGGRIKVLEVKADKDQVHLRVQLDHPADVAPENNPYPNGWRAGPLPPARPPIGKPPAAPAPAAKLMPLAPAAPAAGPVTVESALTLATGPFEGLSLVDDKGKIVPAQYQTRYQFIPGGQPKIEYHITYKPEKDKAPPAQLVYTGRRSATVDVPFTLKEIALP